MIRTDELRGIIAKNGMSQKDVAAMIGVTPKTFYQKMEKGIFGSDEPLPNTLRDFAKSDTKN